MENTVLLLISLQWLSVVFYIGSSIGIGAASVVAFVISLVVSCDIGSGCVISAVFFLYRLGILRYR